METWKSPRAVEAEKQKAKLEAFDRLIDLSLEGIITREEAIEAFKFDGAIYPVVQ